MFVIGCLIYVQWCVATILVPFWSPYHLVSDFNIDPQNVVYFSATWKTHSHHFFLKKSGIAGVEVPQSNFSRCSAVLVHFGPCPPKEIAQKTFFWSLNPRLPTRKSVESCMNREGRMWWYSNLHEMQVFTVVTPRNSGQHWIVSYIQVVLLVHCILYLLYNHPVHSDVKVNGEGCEWSQWQLLKH